MGRQESDSHLGRGMAGPGCLCAGYPSSRQIKADGLGLMWLQPGCNGPCDVQLEYDGGTELLICRLLSAVALAALVVFFLWGAVRAALRSLRGKDPSHRP
jgi:hypothetical protein